MTDVISSGTQPYTYFNGRQESHHRDNDAVKITEAIGNATHHNLNSQQVTQKEISDSARDVLLDNAQLKQQVAGVTDAIHQDGNFSRNDIKAEGRNVDNKVCMVERHISDVRKEMADGFCHTRQLIQENKFELTKQNSELKLLFSDKICHLEVKTLEQNEKTRTLIYEQELAELRHRVRYAS